MLNRSAVLVVEDEPIIAMALAFAIREANGVVVGPAASVKAALILLKTHNVVAAILDANVTDGIITPVVQYLMQRQIPVIVQTGVGIPDDLAEEFPGLIVRIKPALGGVLVAELAQLITDRENALKEDGSLLSST